MIFTKLHSYQGVGKGLLTGSPMTFLFHVLSFSISTFNTIVTLYLLRNPRREKRREEGRKEGREERRKQANKLNRPSPLPFPNEAHTC